MKRLLLVALVVAGCSSAAAIQPRAYAPLPTSAFSTWPVDPIRRPTVPGSERHPPVQGATPSGAGTTAPSLTPPTSRPTGRILPPLIEVKGVAGISTWYSYHPGQAAAAARLRAYLGPSWRGQVVLVCHASACLRIRLTDYESSQIPGRLMDLDSSDFRRLCGPLGLGVCAVTVTGE